MRPAQQGSEHLAGLVAIVINGLLAQNDQLRLLFVDQRFEQLGHSQWLQFFSGVHQNGAVCAYGHGGAQGFLALRHAAADGDDFGGGAFFFEPGGFFNGNFVKRVHAHLDVGDVHTATVSFDAHLDVVVHHAFDGYQNLHLRSPKMIDRG